MVKIITVEGKKYILGKIKHDSKKKINYEFKLIPYDEGGYDKVVDDIINKVKNTVDPKEVLKEALANLEYDEILKIQKALMSNKAKPKANRGCYEIHIGNREIPIVY